MIRALAVLLIVTAALPARADDLDPLYLCKKRSDSDKLTVSFKPGVRLDNLVTWYIGFSCATIVYSEEVACRTAGATLIVPEAITGAQARELFFDAIEVMGLHARVKGNKVVLTEAPGKPRTPQPQCQATSPDPVSHAATPSPPPPPPAPEPQATGKLDLSGIKKLDATHVEIPRTLLAAIFAEPMAVMRSVRLVATPNEAHPTGYKLYAIRPGSLWDVAGLANGDTLLTVAGKALTSPDDALTVVVTLQTATAFTVTLTRRGKPLTLEYVVP